MVKILLVLIFDCAVPEGFPVAQPSAGENCHVALSNGEKLAQRRLCLVEPAGLGIAGGEPTPYLVDRIPLLLQSGYRFAVASRGEIGDALEPSTGRVRIMPLRQV